MRSYIIFLLLFPFFFLLTYSSVFITQKLLLNIFSMPLCFCFCAAFFLFEISWKISRRSYCEGMFEAHSESVFFCSHCCWLRFYLEIGGCQQVCLFWSCKHWWMYLDNGKSNNNIVIKRTTEDWINALKRRLKVESKLQNNVLKLSQCFKATTYNWVNASKTPT